MTGAESLAAELEAARSECDRLRGLLLQTAEYSYTIAQALLEARRALGLRPADVIGRVVRELELQSWLNRTYLDAVRVVREMRSRYNQHGGSDDTTGEAQGSDR